MCVIFSIRVIKRGRCFVREMRSAVVQLAAAAVLLLAAVVVVSAKDKLPHLDNKHSLLDNEKDVWFDSLTEDELHEKWSHDDGTSIAHKISALSRFEGTVFIDVRLVGFDGPAPHSSTTSGGANELNARLGGNMDLLIGESEFNKYFDIPGISSESKAHVINTATANGGAGDEQSHDLSLKMKHVFRVSKAKPSLTAAVANAVAAMVDPHKADMEVRVPVSSVDELIRADYAEHGMSYTIYILNPSQPKRMMSNLPPLKDGTYPPNAERRLVPIKYTYTVDAAAGALTTAGASAPCGTILWVGTGRDDRYAWIDLTAGPTSYGPQTSGDGIVTEFTIPRPDRKLFLPHLLSSKPPGGGAAKPGTPTAAAAGDAKKFGHDTRPDSQSVVGTPHDPNHPPMTNPSLAANSDEVLTKAPKPLSTVELNVRHHELLAELAAVVRKTVRLLVVPSIDRFPITYTKKITINVVVIHDQPDTPTDTINSWASWDARWSPAADELLSLGLVGQTVSVVTDHVMFDECELCVAAYTHSLKSHTSNVMLADGLRTQVHRYLDSADMRDWLEHFEDAFWGIKADAKRAQGTDPVTGEITSVRAVTAFVFDINTPEILLLDRFHQALSFGDMVIAVQTRAPAAVVDFSCGGKSLQFDPRDVSRPLLAGVLQTTWGVAPTDTYWNPFSREAEHDYLWATSPTPFGYFSNAKRLSFPQRDAVARHVLFSDLNHTMTELSDIFQHFSYHGKEIEEVLTPAEHVTFLRRWNVFTFKLQRAQHFLSVPNFNQSLFYVRSSHHDLDALHSIVHTALKQLQPKIVCKTKTVTSGWSWIRSALSFMLLLSLPISAFVLTSNTFWNSLLVRRLLRQRRKHIE